MSDFGYMVFDDGDNGDFMSVLVKDMRMPYGCGDCCFCSSPDYDHNGRAHYRCIAPVAGVCESDNTIEVLNLWEGGTSDTFPAYCPLAELPEHHGRLIDEDEIIIPSLSSWSDQDMVADAIMDAPTIIKAE